MTFRTHTTLGAAAVIALVAASCAGGSDPAATSNGPEVTLGTVPASQDTDEPATTESAPPPTEPAETESVATDDSSAESSRIVRCIVHDGSHAVAERRPADRSHSHRAAPVTTLPGPLPTPDVRLIEVASFDEPVEATGAVGDTRLFIVENGGVVIATDDESTTTVFDIADVAGATFTNEGNEQGLLGLAFHPEIDLVYVDFTTATATRSSPSSLTTRSRSSSTPPPTVRC